MALQQREKRLLLVTGVVAAVIAVLVVGNQIRGAFATRASTRRSLQDQLDGQTLSLMKAAQARAKLSTYEQRSLPRNPSVATALYQDWLLQQVAAAGWDDPSVIALPPEMKGDAYRRQEFTLAGKGSLEKLLKFLYAFYRSDQLHLLKKCHVTPQDKLRELQFDVSIETLSLPAADRDKELAAGERKLPHEIDHYRNVIETRNLLGLPNRPPAFDRMAPVSARPGQPLTFTAKAKDPDEIDILQYALEGTVPTGATIDAKTGRFRWEPAKTVAAGEYEVTVRATDSGTPTKFVTQKVKLTIEPYGLRLASIDNHTVEPEKEFRLPLRLTEVDPSAKVTWTLAGDVPPGATLDAKGEFRWTPSLEYDERSVELQVVVQDDASPPHKDSRTFRLLGKTRKPPELVFDFPAQHTVLTAIVQSQGELQAWLFVRPTGQTIKLPHPDVDGDARWKFRAGSIEGKLVAIHENSGIVIETQGRQLVIPLGKSLSDYVLPPGSPKSAAAK